jgi:cell division protein FtsB
MPVFAPHHSEQAERHTRRRLRSRWVRRLFGDSTGVTAVLAAILVLVCLLLVRPVIMSLLSWNRTAGLLGQRHAEVDSLLSQNAQLKATLRYYGTDAFIAERAREYGLVRPGETQYVVRELAHPQDGPSYARTQLENATQAPVQQASAGSGGDGTSTSAEDVHVPAP